MGGKRGVTRRGARLAVVFASTVLGMSVFSGIAAAAPKACSGRVSASCTTTTSTGHTTKSTQIVEGSDSAAVTAPVAAPAAVSAPKASTGTVKAPGAPKVSAGAKSAARTDHKKKDSPDDETEADAEDHGDEDCGDDDIGDAPDADDDDEDCTTGSTPDPEPCDDADSDEDGDDDGENDDDGDDGDDGDNDEDCETPEPPVPPTPPTPPAPPSPPAPPAAPGTTVLPRQIDRLPTTGADVTSLFLIGLMLVAIGGATRIRTKPLRVVFAGQGSAAELILIQYMNHVATQRTIRARRR